jgi:hypothetical protein
MDPDFASIQSRLDKLEGMMLGRFGPISDPAPDDLGRFRWPFGEWRIPIPIPNPGDPAPIDFSRFSKVQLQLTLHQIGAERIRLEAMEEVIKEQLAGKNV